MKGETINRIRRREARRLAHLGRLAPTGDAPALQHPASCSMLQLASVLERRERRESAREASQARMNAMEARFHIARHRAETPPAWHFTAFLAFAGAVALGAVVLVVMRYRPW